jgi:hypothetical protein
MASEHLESKEATAWRLKCLRMAVSGDNQTAFAAQLGIEANRWNNMERGSPLSKEVAFLIVRRFPDISFDWLFRGKDDHLTVKRQRELAEAGKTLTSAVRSRTRVG